MQRKIRCLRTGFGNWETSLDELIWLLAYFPGSLILQRLCDYKSETVKHRFFITEDGYLISNYHVVKDATKVRLLTSAGLIDAKVVQVDAANDLVLLKADGRFAPLPIAASRTGLLGGTVATVGFSDIGLRGFAPKVSLPRKNAKNTKI